MIQGFEEKDGFPQCAGAVDGTHIPIASPQHCPADHYNRKGWHSVIMQGVVDYHGLFTDIYVGWSGQVHDARVFSNSALYRKGQTGTLFPGWKKRIVGKEVLHNPFFHAWLMKAFPDNGCLTQQQKTFNFRLSSTRVVVEHVYGRLKERWRCLLKRLDNIISLEDVPTVVAACCVLHNICEMNGDSFDEGWLEDGDDCSAGGRNCTSTNSEWTSYSRCINVVLL